MNSNFLNKALSQFCESNSTSQQYILPTVHNLADGTYISEILDVKEIIKPDESLDAIDFYHKLTDSSGNIIYVRFRYYNKELPALATSLSQYPKVKTWKDVVWLQEEIIVAPKPTGTYKHIVARKDCSFNVTSTSSNASATNTHPSKRGILSSRLSSRSGKYAQATKQALIVEDEGDEFDDFLDETDK